MTSDKNIPANLYQLINSYNVDPMQCEYSVQKTTRCLTITLNWILQNYKQNRKNAEVAAQSVTREVSTQTCPLDDQPHTDAGASPKLKPKEPGSRFSRNFAPSGGKNGFKRCDLIGRDGYATEIDVTDNSDFCNDVVKRMTLAASCDVKEYLGKSANREREDNNSEDESTVSVSSLDSAENNTDDSDSSAKIESNPIVSDYIDEDDKATIFNSTCSIPVPIAITPTESPVTDPDTDAELKNSSNNVKSTSTKTLNISFPNSGPILKDSRNCLSPIQEMSDIPSNAEFESTSNDESTVNGDDQSCREDDFPNFEGCSQEPEQCVSIGYVYLNTPSPRGATPSDHDFVSPGPEDGANYRKDANHQNNVQFGKRKNFSFGEVTQEFMVQIYKESMTDLLVVRATKYRLAPDELCELLSSTGMIDFKHIDDIYYDEVVMTRASYIIQLKPNLANIREKFKSPCDQVKGNVLKISDGDDEVKVTVPQMNMMDKIWRNKFLYC